MRKIAIFVEGWTEQIFVRNLLHNSPHVGNISFSCRTLFNDSDYNPAPFDYPNPQAAFHYEVINVGNDVKLLSSILRREPFLWNEGYEVIVGLRDMYSKEYRDESRKIREEVNRKFLEGAQHSINSFAKQPARIHFCFAIMEVEAWFLAWHHIFVQLDSQLTPAYILAQTGIDLTQVDPETEIFHPAQLMDRIYQLVGKRYDKRKGSIEALTCQMNDFEVEYLLEEKKCASFNHFFTKIPFPN